MQNKFDALKKKRFETKDLTLVIIHERKQNRKSIYTLNYVRIDEVLPEKFKAIVVNNLEPFTVCEPYSFDSPDPEPDRLLGIDHFETDFYEIFGTLKDMNPEQDVITDAAQLLGAKAYLFVLRGSTGIEVVCFKTLPEKWSLSKRVNIINIMFHNQEFVDMKNDDVFRISNQLDFVYYDETIFILDKRNFEFGLNYREGMLQKAETVYEEFATFQIFESIDILKAKVTNNQRYLRKMAMIKNLGHHKNPQFIDKMIALNQSKGWGINFNDRQIVITEETVDKILVILQNKRLHSELTDEDFDVESARPAE
jgi:hypothetical protein